jgi:hypothetical protein
MDSMLGEKIYKLAQCHEDNCKILMVYWDTYKDEITAIFGNHYKMGDLPMWVNYELFKNDMICDMADHMFNCVLDNQEEDSIHINFSNVVGIGLSSNHIRDRLDRIWLCLEDELCFSSSIVVEYIKMGG